jgi:phage FluMu protein Com
MAIRFHCQRCRQLLGIASRKAGSEIECPKCGWSQLVPNEEAAAAALAMDRFASNREAVETASELTVYDDLPAAIETPPPVGGHQATPEISAPPAAPQSSARSGLRAGQPLPSGMILYPRRTLYVQAALLLILFLVGFGSGYIIGHSGAEGRGSEQPAGGQPTLIEGTVVYGTNTGRLAGDQDAVIIALPQGKSPQKRISSEGIGPRAVTNDAQGAAGAIRQLGGAYTRADASGDFSLVVPDRGRYHLLIISRHAIRPEGTGIDEADLIEMQRYFGNPDLLIGRHKYRWTSAEISSELEITQTFN